MKPAAPAFLLLVACAWPASPQAALRGFPFQDETLRYEVKLPTGTAIGQGTMTAKLLDRPSRRWQFEFSLDASLPAFSLVDKFRSRSTGYCSDEFTKESLHGKRKANELVKFDQAARQIKRTTMGGGGTSTIAVGECARDALTYLYFSRREMGQGRVPPAEQVIFGAAYQTRVEYKGERKIKIGGKEEVTDQLTIGFKGPASDHSFQVFYARDAARTPLRISVPLGSAGTFDLDLVR